MAIFIIVLPIALAILAFLSYLITNFSMKKIQVNKNRSFLKVLIFISSFVILLFLTFLFFAFNITFKR